MTNPDPEQKAWRQRRRSKEARIREAAVTEFCRHGYAGASLQAIADALGMNKASLYHYLPSKEHLLATILDYAHDQIIEIMDEVLKAESEPLARLRRFLETHLVWYLENLELAKVAFHEWTNLSGDLLAAQRNRRRHYDDYVRGLIRAGQASGAIHADWDVTLAANYIIGAINAVPSWYRRRGHKNAETIARIYADMALAMLTSRPQPRTQLNE